MIFSSYNNYKQQKRKLITLYNASIYSYNETKDLLTKKIYDDTIDYDASEKIYLNNITDDTHLIAGNSYELRNNFKNRFQINLREVLLVRIISTLEVFLIDNLKEIFLVRKDLFHSNSTMELSYNELLSSDSMTNIWNKIINKEARKLQNQGFKDIQKYYMKFFEIDFNKYGDNISILYKTHEMRHLLVHRLGKTDELYRKQYNTNDKSIKFTEDELKGFIDEINKFIIYINKESQLLFSNQNKKNNNHSKLYFEINIINNEVNNIFEPNYKFFINEKLIVLNDHIKSINKIDENNFTMKLVGELKILEFYKKLLQKYEKAIQIKIIKLKLDKNKDYVFTEEVLESVKNLLGEKPYPMDIHKIIAKELGYSNSYTYKAIERLN